MTTLPNDSGFDVVLVQEKQGNSLVWTAFHPRLPGCNATGKSELQALKNLAKSRRAWINSALDDGQSIPAMHDQAAIKMTYWLETNDAQRPRSASLNAETQTVCMS